MHVLQHARQVEVAGRAVQDVHGHVRGPHTQAAVGVGLPRLLLGHVGHHGEGGHPGAAQVLGLRQPVPVRRRLLVGGAVVVGAVGAAAKEAAKGHTASATTTTTTTTITTTTTTITTTTPTTRTIVYRRVHQHLTAQEVSNKTAGRL